MENVTEQRLIFIEVMADHWKYADLSADDFAGKALLLNEGWRIVSVSIAGAGQNNYRTYALAVIVEGPGRKMKEISDQPKVDIPQ